MTIVKERHFAATQLTLQLRGAPGATGTELPDGVCGRITGIALVYNVPDDYGTVFLPGCLTKTRAEKISTNKVKLFADHGPFTETHVGVVRSIEDVGDTAVLTADLFDTEAGRAMKEYLAAVLASGADTGLSIGFRPRDKEWRRSPDGTEAYLFYKEIELRETSITPVPAVPGTDVTSVRHEAPEDGDLLRRTLRSILSALPEQDARAIVDAAYTSSTSPTTQPSAAIPDTGATAPVDPAPKAAIEDAAPDAAETSETAGAHDVVTEEMRMMAFRSSFALTTA